ncbi:MAG: POTRA domain-containing protein [Bacteroidales bacterium]|nr:POTRA domain-containing protein [Bacteroidales bacterium]MDG2081277.1 POTRA domain-containing protein [Bacteroidales bacterium]
MTRLSTISFILLLVFNLNSNHINAEIQVGRSDTLVKVGEITITGNKITKSRIILRELEFSSGSSMELGELDSLMIKSQQNLINRSLFNFVTLKKVIINDTINVNINVVERWYFWPIPIIQFADRNINAWLNKKDFSRVNYGIDLRVDNFRGLMEKLNIIIQLGYDVILGAKWTIPYLTKNQVLGVSLNGGIQLNHTVAYKTVDNKEQFYNSPSGYAQQNIYGNVGLTFRPGFNYLHTFNVGYNNYMFQDTILDLNPNFGDEMNYSYFSISYSFKLDYRDYKPYPLKGYYFETSVTKNGVGLFNNNVDNTSLNISFDQYLNIHKKLYFGYNVRGKVSTEKPMLPYFIKSGLGYFPTNIRGYELYVVDGQQIAIFKSNLKYEVIPKTKFNIKWIKSTKFNESFLSMYANIFFDLAYVSDVNTAELNPLSNQFLFATGLGLDFVTYYDLVLRLELSYNKQNEIGFYIGFVAPI